MGAERARLAAVLGSSLFVMVFEGAGVGLLVPLLSLLLGGENATPMRPLQWLERQLPGTRRRSTSPSVCVAIVVAIAAKNAAAYTSQVLAADLKKRIAINVRDGAVPPPAQRRSRRVRSIARRRDRQRVPGRNRTG